MPAKIAVAIPTYNKFAYARRACLSALKHTKSPIRLYVIDDASPKYQQQNWDLWKQGIPDDVLRFHHFEKNGGLTRSWNTALQWAREEGCEYTVCTNSDILFTPHWEEGLLHQLDRGYHLVGPVSNAPGQTNGGRQRVGNFFPGYKVTDDAAYLAKVARYLRAKQSLDKIVGGLPINGFFMIAKTSVWWEGAFDDKHVFNPAKKMAGNEDELERRWRKRGFKIGFVPSSFVFHYRSVSRGDRHKQKGWHRLDDIHKAV